LPATLGTGVCNPLQWIYAIVDTGVVMSAANIQVAKWGNSLALRIPADQARRIGIKEGDSLEARVTADGSLSLRPAPWDRKGFLHELEEARKSMPMGESVMDEVRSGGRY
jgi:antitoxin MazE